MSPWVVYKNRFVKSFFGVELTSLEKWVLAAVFVMLGVCVFDALQGQDVGNPNQIHVAKMQAEQALMAQRITETSPRE